MYGRREILKSTAKGSIQPELVTIGDLEQFKTELLLFIKALLTDNKGKATRKWLKSYEVKKIRAAPPVPYMPFVLTEPFPVPGLAKRFITIPTI